MDKYFHHIGLKYEKYEGKLHVFVFLLANVFYLLKWLLQSCVRTLRVIVAYLRRDAFKFLNLVLTIMSNVLMVYWVLMIVLLGTRFDDNGHGIIEQTYKFRMLIGSEDVSYIDVYSYVAYLMETYIMVAAFNSMLTLWRIFQFFRFSIKLSVFTEILKASKNDILYFLIMFLIFLLGFAVMANTYYGENLAEYSDLWITIIQLFMMMMTCFTYSDFGPYSSLSPLFFVSFMVLFMLFLLNMLIAIIMAHYTEYQKQISSMGQSNEDEQQGLLQLLFNLVKDSVAP